MPKITTGLYEVNECNIVSDRLISRLNSSLLTMGKEYLKPHLRDAWSPENPTMNYCYVVSEYVYWYEFSFDAREWMKVHSRILKIPSRPEITHWFIQFTYRGLSCESQVENIIDLTSDQFGDDEEVDYTKSKRKGFIPINGFLQPSTRTKKLAELMGHHPDKWNDYQDWETHLAMKGAGLI